MAYATPENTNIGDGVTMIMWSDRYAYTVISKTATTITVQRDEAILDPNFSPEIIPCGFLGHCINQDEQEYAYIRNHVIPPIRVHYSKKHGCYMDHGRKFIAGRHEFYDYNF